MTKPKRVSCSHTLNIKTTTTKKAKASPLREKDYCYVLQPKADQQGSKIHFRDFRWIGPHVVEREKPNENYIVRKVNTNKTQL